MLPMGRLAILLALTLPGLAQSTIEAFGLKWLVPVAADWKLQSEDEIPTLQLLVPRPSTQPRRPTQYALAQTPDYQSLTVEVDVRKEQIGRAHV